MTNRARFFRPRFVAVYVGIAIAIAVVFLIDWRFVESEEFIGMSDHAQRHPFLAAHRFLEDLGVRTANVTMPKLWKELPSTSDVLFVDSSNSKRSQYHVDALNSWVHNGGHLVYVPFWPVSNEDSARANQDLLIEERGLRVVRPDKQFMAESCEGGEKHSVQVSGEEVEALFVSGTSLSGTDNEESRQLMNINVGNGRITFLSESTLFRNPYIGCAQNAHLLRTVLPSHRNSPTLPSAVLWVTDPEMEHLLVQIWKGQTVVVSFLLAALAMWLWRSMYRPAPPRQQEAQDRRSIVEYTTFAARFAWAQQGSGAVLRTLRNEILSAHGDSVGVGELERLSRRTGIELSSVRDALGFGSEPETEAELTEAVRTLQALREAV